MCKCVTFTVVFKWLFIVLSWAFSGHKDLAFLHWKTLVKSPNENTTSYLTILFINDGVRPFFMTHTLSLIWILGFEEWLLIWACDMLLQVINKVLQFVLIVLRNAPTVVVLESKMVSRPVSSPRPVPRPFFVAYSVSSRSLKQKYSVLIRSSPSLEGGGLVILDRDHETFNPMFLDVYISWYILKYKSLQILIF